MSHFVLLYRNFTKFWWFLVKFKFTVRFWNYTVYFSIPSSKAAKLETILRAMGTLTFSTGQIDHNKKQNNNKITEQIKIIKSKIWKFHAESFYIYKSSTISIKNKSNVSSPIIFIFYDCPYNIWYLHVYQIFYNFFIVLFGRESVFQVHLSQVVSNQKISHVKSLKKLDYNQMIL